MQLKTLGKCRFRPSEGFVKPKSFLYAPRQLMVALRLDSPAAHDEPPPGKSWLRACVVLAIVLASIAAALAITSFFTQNTTPL